MNTKVKKKKISIADLQLKPKRFVLVHPNEEYDIGDAWVEIKHPETSLEYMLVLLKFHNVDVKDITLAEQAQVQIEMLSVLINDWNSEAFGIEFSREAVFELLSNPSNHWIKEQIQEKINAESSFFTKP